MHDSLQLICISDTEIALGLYVDQNNTSTCSCKIKKATQSRNKINNYCSKSSLYTHVILTWGLLNIVSISTVRYFVDRL